jgi:hypothetical protein
MPLLPISLGAVGLWANFKGPGMEPVLFSGPGSDVQGPDWMGSVPPSKCFEAGPLACRATAFFLLRIGMLGVRIRALMCGMNELGGVVVQRGRGKEPCVGVGEASRCIIDRS